MPLASWRILLLLAWALLSVLSAGLLRGAQSQGEQQIRQRFADRAALGASFTASYTRDLLSRERRLARRELSGEAVRRRRFENITTVFGYEAAVLLDARGRALQVVPASSSVIGTDLTRKYSHLRAAAAGRPTVSRVVPSAARGIPVVAFATPFASKHGRRVFSGAFDVASTPIGAFLRNFTPIKGAGAYLVDTTGAIVASNRTGPPAANTLAQAAPRLARGLSRSPSARTSDGYEYASRPVAGTPWRLVLAAPADQLFGPIRGFGRRVPWIVWAGFLFGGLGSALLVGNLIDSRRRLRAANEDLDRLAGVDALTGLYNRRQIQASLDAAVANSERYEDPLSVLMIDVDRFKQINDTWGHEVGDGVLRFVSRRLLESLRADDLVGRWGGDEFLALLPCTELGEAEAIAARIREAICSTPVVVGSRLVSVSVSTGAAEHFHERPGTLVAEADRAMYAAKAAGRGGAEVVRR